MRSVAACMGTVAQDLRIVSCHLGNGASVTAIEYGRSVETSMGMTPLEGLVMGTRCGDIDPGILLHLMRSGGYDLDAIERLISSESGLKGLAGTNDMREIEARAAAGDESCRLAIALYAHRVRKYVGAYAVVMGGVDVIAFTGGIGEHSAVIRHRVAQRLEFLGAVLDEDQNRAAKVDARRSTAEISMPRSRVRLIVVHADEETAIAAEAAELMITPSAARLRARADRSLRATCSSVEAHARQRVRQEPCAAAAHLDVATRSVCGRGNCDARGPTRAHRTCPRNGAAAPSRPD